MKFNKISMALSGALMLVGANAQALVISYTDSYMDALTELNNEQLRVSLFDSSLGTLTGVSVSLSVAIDSMGAVTNNGAVPQNFTVQTLVQSYGGTGFNLPAPLGDVTAMSPFSLINAESYVALASGDSATFGPGSVSSILNLFTGYDADFIGLGDFGYDFTTLILTTFSGGGGNIGADIETFSDGLLTVEYTYDAAPVVAVPEPGSFLLMGLGLVGLVGVGRRKMKSAAK